jgi:hypothetical protein
MRAIDYDAIVQKALRQVVREILTDTMEHGLVGNHHYYVTFATNHPWVVVPEYLREEFPDEMVIVLQHEFWDLEVTKDNFSVTLYFDDISERITVPFVSIINFVDPSVKFGLQFLPDYDEPTDKEARGGAERSCSKNNSKGGSSGGGGTESHCESGGPSAVGEPEALSQNVADKPKPAGNVISLDDFRKK